IREGQNRRSPSPALRIAKPCTPSRPASRWARPTYRNYGRALAKPARKVLPPMNIGTPFIWTLFTVFVLLALVVDFAAMRRQGAHAVSMREAGIWSLIWVGVSFAFVAWLWWYLGGTSSDSAATRLANDKALEFITGYLVEKALAVD